MWPGGLKQKIRRNGTIHLKAKNYIYFFKNTNGLAHFRFNVIINFLYVM